MTQYENPGGTMGRGTSGHGYTTTRTDVVGTGSFMSRAIDRVRWGPIMAGLFAALSVLALLSALGVAIGLSAYDPGDRARAFGIGFGIWGWVSMLIAFFFGGWLAARSAAIRGEDIGMLNGAMVWAVAIPLMLYLLAGGLTSAVNTASNAAGAAANVSRTSGQAQEQVERVVTASANEPRASGGGQVSAQDERQALKAARRSAWGTFISLVLGLAAASMGGWVGGRPREAVVGERDRERDRVVPGSGTDVSENP